ncbi:MAG: alpha/beta fold hydrolase, partial [Pyrinomonadaceae bacterium]
MVTSTRISASTALWASAASLAGMALFNLYQTKRAEEANQPRGKFISVDGVKLHYLEKGSGTPVILVHGNIVDSNDFESSGVLDLLAERHHVFAFDRPGFGHSDRPHGSSWGPEAQANIILAACAALNIEKPIVVGHSFGAMVALAMGLNHKEAIAGLILASGYYYPSFRSDVLFALPGAIPLIGDILRYTISPLTGSMILPSAIKTMFAPLAVPTRFSANFSKRMPLRPQQLRAESQDGSSMIPSALSTKHMYSSLDLPLIILAGEGDKVVDTTYQSVALHREVPESILTIMPGVGHMVHYAKPSIVAESVEALADSLQFPLTVG